MRRSGLTVAPPRGYLCVLFLRCVLLAWAARHEADLQAPQPQAEQQARVSRPHEDAWGAGSPQPASSEGQEAAHREDRLQVGSERPVTGGKPIPSVEPDSTQRRDPDAVQTGEAEEDGSSGRLPGRFPRFASPDRNRGGEARSRGCGSQPAQAEAQGTGANPRAAHALAGWMLSGRLDADTPRGLRGVVRGARG